MSEAPSIETVNQLLHDVLDPETGRSIIRTKQLYETLVENQSIQLKIGLTSHSLPIENRFKSQLRGCHHCPAWPNLGTQRPVCWSNNVGSKDSSQPSTAA